MARRFVEVTLENLPLVPPEPRQALFWELEVDELPVDPAFQKEEWFSTTLLEWGPCAKLMLDGDVPVGFAEYAAAALFPRLSRFAAGAVSADAIYLSYCYVVDDRRGEGLGTELVRAVAADLLGRGFRALEALGDRRAEPGWVLPEAFLLANGFVVHRDHARFPLLRLELRQTLPLEHAAAIAEPVPEEEPEPVVRAPAPVPAPGLA